jgi:hypothetical protein
MKLPERKWRLGQRRDREGPFEIYEDLLETHGVVTGSTSAGKSRFLTRLCQLHIDNNCGIAVIEPGDLCSDILAYYSKKVVQSGKKDVLKRIHYLRASPEQCFRYDMFKMQMFRTVHPENLESFRSAMIHTKVQSVAEIFQSKQGSESFEAMPRLHRVLTNVLTCIATLVSGKRLAAADVEIILDLTHPLHDAVYRKLLPKLRRNIAADFETLHGFHRLQDLRLEVESTLNRIRTFFGPLVQEILSGTEGKACVDLFDIIQKGHCLLVPLQEDPFFSHDQKISLGAMILHDLIEILIVTPRELRKKFTIVIDEAGELICVSGERLMRALGMIRKHGGRLVLAGQNLGTFRKSKDLDLVPKIMSQCGMKIAFNSQWPEDTEIQGRVMFAGNFSFKERVEEVERKDRMVWHEVTEHSEQKNVQKTQSTTESTQQSTSVSAQESRTTGKTVGEGVTESSQAATGNVETRSKPVHDPDHKEQESKARSTSEGHGNAVSHSTGTSESTGKTTGESKTEGKSAGKTEGQTLGIGHSISHKKIPLAEIYRETVRTGSLEKAFQDQLEEFRQILSCLPKRHAIVRIPTEKKAFEIIAENVPDPFVNIEAQMKAIEWVKKELFQIHPYYFTPDLSPEESLRRLNAFLENDGRVEDDVRPDVIIENGDVVEEPEPDENAYGI